MSTYQQPTYLSLIAKKIPIFDHGKLGLKYWSNYWLISGKRLLHFTRIVLKYAMVISLIFNVFCAAKYAMVIVAQKTLKIKEMGHSKTYKMRCVKW